MNESEAIKAAQAGNLAAFNRLVMRHQGIAYNVAYRLTGDADTAADATQEAFIKAYKAIDQFKGGSFKSWLLRIVSNTCYDQHRYRQRRPSEPLTANPDDNPEYAPHLIDKAERPEETTIRQEMSDMLQTAINKLPEDQRVIVVLSDVEGMAYQEISEITGVPLGTVKSRLNRGRLKLRDFLRKQELLPQKYR